MQALSQLSYGPTRRRGTVPDPANFVKEISGPSGPRVPALSAGHKVPMLSYSIGMQPYLCERPHYLGQRGEFNNPKAHDQRQ